MLKIDTKISIETGAHPIWAAIQDFPTYPKWNTMIVSMAGKPEVGSKLRMNAKGVFGFPLLINATFLAHRENAFVQWGGGIKGLLYGTHSFELHEDSNSNVTELHHYEEFTGLLTLVMKGFIHRKITAAYERHNTALKNHIEKNKP